MPSGERVPRYRHHHTCTHSPLTRSHRRAVEFQQQQSKLAETLHHFDDTVHMLGVRYLRLLDACNIPGLLGIAAHEMQRLEVQHRPV